MYGVGGLVGSLLVGLVARGRRVARLFIAGAALHDLGVVLLAVSPAGPGTLWLPFVCIAVVGMADVAVQVTGTTIVQAAPRDMLGRAFTAFEAALVAAMLVGALAAGPLLTLVGPRGATLAFALVGGVLLLLSLPRLRPLEDVLGVRMFLRGVPMLAGLPRPLLDELASLFEPGSFPAGERIVREGEPGDQLYIIRKGEVEVMVDGQVVRRLGPSGYFGEIALLHRVPRTASVRACSPLELYTLNRADFQTLLHRAGDLEPRLVQEANTRYLYAPTSPLLHH
jgi:MFS family permease